MAADTRVPPEPVPGESAVGSVRCAPGLMEALIARKDESYGSTEEVFA